MVFVARLVIVLLDVVALLGKAPGFGVSLELHAFADREGRDADAGQTEMVGAVEVSGLGARIGTDRQPEFLRGGLHRRIEVGALRAGDLHFFGRSQRLHVVVIQIQSDLSGGNWRMFAQILRAQQSLLLGRDRGEQD